MIRIRIFETRIIYNHNKDPKVALEGLQTEEEVLKHFLESDDKVVIAAFLRGLANSFDPPKTHMRGSD